MSGLKGKGMSCLPSLGGRYPEQTLQDVRNPAFISFLDMARWLAAAIVCFGHLRNPLFLGFGSIPEQDRNIFTIAWYFTTGWFGEAVIMFFVLSGYLVGGISLAKLKATKFNARSYAIDRTTRLYLAFFPALLLTVILDYLGRNYFGESGLYSHQQLMIAEKINSAPFESMANIHTFFGNSIMLQNFYFDAYGTNQPLWTISAEFWFYCVFALAVISFCSVKLVRMCGVLLLVITLVLLGHNFPHLLGMWVVGALIALVGWERMQCPILAVLMFVGLLICLRLFSSDVLSLPMGRVLRDYSVAIFFGYLLFSMRQVSYQWLLKTAGFNKFLASFSFSLYLIHFPVMIFMLSIIYSIWGLDGIRVGYNPTDYEGLILYGLVAVAIYLSAYLFSLATEEQTSRVRRYLKLRLLSQA